MMSPKFLLNILLLSGFAWAWIPSPSTRTSRTPPVVVLRSSANVDTIQLGGLGDNHEQVGAELGASVQRWLDAEWMPQDIHAQIGTSCAATYVACRTHTDDIMTIMTQIADDLSQDWYEKYDQDAFVNAWDIANYVSDYLVKQAGNESCECSAEIH